MYLKSLQVQHYKSLDDVSVDFAPDVTVVVGPNGVGKSNFVDVLRFLRDAVVDDLEHAVTKREGIQRLLQTYKTKPYKIGIQLNFSAYERDQVADTASYSIQLKSVGSSGYTVESEKAVSAIDELELGILTSHESVARDARGIVTIDDNPPGSQKHSLLEHTIIAYPPETLVLGSKLLGVEPRTIASAITDQIAAWNFCTIYPNTLKKPALPDRDSKLMESGDNWASVIKALKRSPKGREALERIYDAMRAVLPTFEEVSIQTVGSYLVPLFKFRVEGEATLASFDPVQLSDGTLRLFGILLAAYQLPRPKLLVIEEPEQTIYPAALAVLADMFKEIGRSTQVLITTHSPHLVQFFAPSQIRVAVMHNGMTHIRPIHPHQMEAVNEGLLSLEEFMTTEGLRPDDTENTSS
ncbi:AAA family ATPase [Rhodoferax sp.]|uniref:AAA family ATPase n=1 Tax=Rhodoferax sp. TaxID=50421 RepID=UPI002847E4E2|nr:AAA family ATPase [Rhodoferax sp.]MDR3369651.1 AAA family ATPase [Rhodoferax sp.]